MDLTEHEHPRELWKRAQRRWPAIERGQPLAIGVGEQLTDFFASLGLSKRAARRLTRWWFSSLHYAEACCRVGAVRVDLDGKPVGSVTAADAAFAAERLEQLKAHIASKPRRSPVGGEKQRQPIRQKNNLARHSAFYGPTNGIAESDMALDAISKMKVREARTNPVTGRRILSLNWKSVDTRIMQNAVE